MTEKPVAEKQRVKIQICLASTPRLCVPCKTHSYRSIIDILCLELSQQILLEVGIPMSPTGVGDPGIVSVILKMKDFWLELSCRVFAEHLEGLVFCGLLRAVNKWLLTLNMILS